MNIAGLVTCVGYAHLLARGLHLWLSGLDSIIVVTTPSDADTLALCDRKRAPRLATQAFLEDGASFNKARALEEGLAAVAGRGPDWILFFDADVIPPKDWRAQLDAVRPTPGRIYGAARRDEDGKPIPDGELAGFFHLWHVSDPVAQDRPLLGSWRSAGAYDSVFLARWPKERQVLIPALVLEHVGPRATNWCGVGNDEALGELFEERRRRGGWQHERLDRVPS